MLDEREASAREYVGMGLLPAAIRSGMQSGSVIMRLPAPKGVTA